VVGKVLISIGTLGCCTICFHHECNDEFEFDTYRNVLIKWLRFCYGENQFFSPRECPDALVLANILNIKETDRINDTIIIDEYGWKQITGDVFRPPRHQKTLSAFIGTGF